MRLGEIAHTRTGDKGDTCNVSVIAFDARDYPRLARHVTADRVKALYGDRVRGDVVRYELPNIGALNFVLTQALGGGVTRSVALDAHGKSLGSALLALEIPWED
jgi:hypothetical protein